MDQMDLLKNLMDSQRHVAEIMSTNENLQLSLSLRGRTIDRLQQLTIASASLISSVDSTSAETEPSSLQVLSRLGSSTAITPEDEPEPDFTKEIAAKLLNEILAVVVKALQERKGSLSIIQLSQLELQLSQIVRSAETKEVIPKTEDGTGWKKRAAMHQPIYAQIAKITKASQEDPSEPDTEGEGEDDD
jgi:hypothetical protein